MNSATLPQCDVIFNDPRLHLVVWDRSDLPAHEAGLRFMGELSEVTGLAGRVMPLLRPIGRSCSDAANTRCKAVEWSGAGAPWSCELWIQADSAVEKTVWSAIAGKISSGWNADAGRDLGDASYAQWQPFGNSPTDSYVLQSGPLRATTEDGIYGQLADFEKAAVLKLLWWQALATLIAECVQSKRVRVFDPSADRNAMADLLKQMLRPVRLAHFGLGKAGDVVDPSRFGASHLACFALNAFLERGVDLDQAYSDLKATRPHHCNDLPHYIAGIRTGRW